MKRIFFIPKSNFGLLSVAAIILFGIFLAIFYIFVYLGERGGEAFFSNLKLAVPITAAGLSGTLSFLFGMVAIFQKKDRAVSVLFSTSIGVLVFLYIMAEIFGSY